MKVLLLMLIGVFNFSWLVQANPNPSRNIDSLSVTKEKWELYKLLDDIEQELNYNEQSQTQIERSFNFFENSFKALLFRGPRPGKGLAKISFEEGQQYNFGHTTVGGQSSAQLKLVNTGDQTAEAISFSGMTAPFSFKGGGYPGKGGTCGTTLAPEGSCTVVIEVEPTSTSLVTNVLTVIYDDGNDKQESSIDLQSTGVSPAILTISETDPYDFGDVTAGAVNSLFLIITNTGGTAATSMSGVHLVSPFYFAGGSYPGAGGTCTTALNPGTTCSVVINFAPVSTGYVLETLELNYFDGAATVATTRNLQGTGLSPAILTISETDPYNFGEVTENGEAVRTFTVTNTGGSKAGSISGFGLTRPFLFSGGGFPGNGGDCRTTLSPGSLCQIAITFAPTASGVAFDTLELNYLDGAAAQTSTRDLTGYASAPALLSIKPSLTIDFGNVPLQGESVVMLTVTNTGGSEARSIHALGLSAPFSYTGLGYPGTGGDCGSSLPAGTYCQLSISFSPSRQVSSLETLSLNYFDGVKVKTSSKSLRGRGVTPAVLTISNAPEWDFGTVVVGTKNRVHLTVTNSGGFEAWSLEGLGLAAPFSFEGGSFPGTTGDCGVTLKATASCTLAILYSPMAVSADFDKLMLNYDDGVFRQTAFRGLQGAAVAPAKLTISEVDPYDFGLVEMGQQIFQTFIITNTGGARATQIKEVSLATPFLWKKRRASQKKNQRDCNSSLSSGDFCEMVVSFEPTSSGVFSGSLSLDYHSGVSSEQSFRTVVGTGANSANLVLSDGPTYDFLEVAPGHKASHIFTLTNSGGMPADNIHYSSLQAPFSFAGGLFPGVGGTCTSILSSGSSCTLSVEYAPLVPSAADQAELSISYSTGHTIMYAKRQLVGSSKGLPKLEFLSGNFFFNLGHRPVGSVSFATFTIINNGSAGATLKEAQIPAPFFVVKKGPVLNKEACHKKLSPGQHCQLIVKFAPKTLGPFADYVLSMTYTSSDGAANSVSKFITAYASTPAKLTISDGPVYDFGNQPLKTKVYKEFEVVNIGQTAAYLNEYRFRWPQNSPAFSFLKGKRPCGQKIKPGESCSFKVSFYAYASKEYKAAAWLGYHDGVANTWATRELRGSSFSSDNFEQGLEWVVSQDYFDPVENNKIESSSHKQEVSLLQ